MADSWSWFGNQGAAGSILGALGTAATIYGLYSQQQQQQDKQSLSNEQFQQNFAERQRQFDLKQKLAEMGLSQSAEAAAAATAAQVQAAHSHAISGAYDSLIKAVENGRGGEAAVLSSIVDKIQRAYAQR